MVSCICHPIVYLISNDPFFLSPIRSLPHSQTSRQDIAGGSMMLIAHATAALNIFADHESVIRSQLKDIRTKEEQLEELRKRRKATASKLEAQERRLSKMGSEVSFNKHCFT